MKLVKKIRGFKIYDQQNDVKNLFGYHYAIYCPGESPAEFCSPEWECDSLEEAIQFVNAY